MSDKQVLILWSDAEDAALAHLAGDLAGVLRSSAAPEPLTPLAFDIGERMGTLSLARSLVGALGGARTEAAMVASLLAPELEREIGGGVVGAVVALDRTAAIIADRWAQKGLLDAPVLGLCPRLAFDEGWRRSVDRLLVLDEEQRAAALAVGFDEGDVVVIGPLPGPRVAAAGRQPRAALRERFGLAKDQPVVLFAASELDELTTLLFQTTLLNHDCQLLFDVADDDEAAALLRRRAKGFGVRAQLFGRGSAAAELWACADVVVAKPSPRLERRALFLRQALLALPDDDEALATVRPFVERRLGRAASSSSTFAAELDGLLADLPGLRERLAARPRGELSAVARAVRRAEAEGASLLAKRALARQVKRRGSVAPESSLEEEPSSASPLESIGPEEGAAVDPARDEELAAAEADANERVGERQREVARWERRLELARQKGDRSLVREAEKELDLQRSAMHAALAELARLDGQRRGRPAPKKHEARLSADFRRMEVESALDALKRKLRG